jgi:hypothetical protein
MGTTGSACRHTDRTHHRAHPAGLLRGESQLLSVEAHGARQIGDWERRVWERQLTWESPLLRVAMPATTLRLVVRLPRWPGGKGDRWPHLLAHDASSSIAEVYADDLPTCQPSRRSERAVLLAHPDWSWAGETSGPIAFMLPVDSKSTALAAGRYSGQSSWIPTQCRSLRKRAGMS